MLNIVFLDRASLPVALPTPSFVHSWHDYAATAPDEVLSRLAEADIAITNKVRLDAVTLKALPRLKMIAVAATGTNNVDLSAARDQGLVVSNIRGYADATVPEHALMLMLTLARNLMAYRQDVAAGAWEKSPYFCHFGAPIRDLNGHTLTIIGKGSLGTRTAVLAQAFGMQVIYAEHRDASTVREGYAAFEEALRQADFISIHCPLNDTTRNLIGERELRWLKRDAIIVNTARGGIVDELALLAALKEGRLGGAGLDVLLEEPPLSGNLLLETKLPNLIITPHISWASAAAMNRLATQLIENIEAWVSGVPRNVV